MILIARNCSEHRRSEKMVGSMLNWKPFRFVCKNVHGLYSLPIVFKVSFRWAPADVIYVDSSTKSFILIAISEMQSVAWPPYCAFQRIFIIITVSIFDPFCGDLDSLHVIQWLCSQYLWNVISPNFLCSTPYYI